MRIRYALLSLLSLLLFAAPAAAHDFWLQPVRFQIVQGEPFGATFEVGHGAARQRWSQDASRIVMLTDFSAQGRRDLRPDLSRNPAADLITSFATPGLHILALQSTYAMSNLPSIRFNDYAAQEGLALILAERQRSGTSGAEGRERYSRRAKALIEVGPRTPANDRLATRSVGLKLEIVPERNPYALGASRMLPVRILYKGRRLGNATVKLTNLGDDAKPVAIARTDRNGRAQFRIPTSGQWLLNTLWSEPVRGNSKIDFDTTFSSLTFGYSPARQAR